MSYRDERDARIAALEAEVTELRAELGEDEEEEEEEEDEDACRDDGRAPPSMMWAAAAWLAALAATSATTCVVFYGWDRLVHVLLGIGLVIGGVIVFGVTVISIVLLVTRGRM